MQLAKLILVAAGVLVALPAASAADHAPRNLEEMRATIAARGSTAAARQIASDPAALELLASGVTGGRHEWLEVGVQIVGVAGPYVRERLIVAFGRALEGDPESVLAASGVPLNDVCGYDPLTLMSSLPPCKTLDRLLAPRLSALASVKRADLVDARDACVTAIARLKADAPNRSCTP